MTRTLRIAQPRVTLADPHDCTDASDTLAVFNAVFDTLIRRGSSGYEPSLAKEYDVSPDALIWRFSIRADIRFHDGTPLDAAAVVANLTRLARPDKGYTLGAPGVWHQFLGPATIRQTGTLTLEIVLAEPIADLPDILVQCFIASPECLGALDRGEMDAVVGSGPYTIETVAPTELAMVATPDHFAGPPPFERIVWHGQPDTDLRRDSLASGAVDIANRIGRERPVPNAAVLDYVSPVAIIYLFNAAHGPLVDPRVRRALNLAIDRSSLIQTVLGGAAVPLTGFISAVHFGADTEPGQPTDRDLARDLLRQSGHGNGLRLTVSCPTRLPDEAEALTAALAEQLSEVGVILDVTVHQDREAYAHMVRRKEIGDLAVFDSSPMSTFRVLYEKLDSRIGGSWWQGYSNPRVEALLDRARRTVDTAARAAIYREAYREIRHDPPWLFLYNPVQTMGIAENDPGVRMRPDGVLDVTRVDPAR